MNDVVGVQVLDRAEERVDCQANEFFRRGDSRALVHELPQIQITGGRDDRDRRRARYRWNGAHDRLDEARVGRDEHEFGSPPAAGSVELRFRAHHMKCR